MIDHGVACKVDLAGDPHRFGPGLSTFELDAVIRHIGLDATKGSEKVDMPEFTPEFTIRDTVQTHGLLFSNDIADCSVLNGSKSFS